MVCNSNPAGAGEASSENINPIYEMTTNVKTPTKSVLKSKTLWLQLLTLVSVFVPPAREFLAANPVESVAVITAANTVVRFVTSGRLTLLDE